jgi:2-polyprenyl-3-methyl-5-hydroxy-6-metoxy-1,4-benzoquinol methylase
MSNPDPFNGASDASIVASLGTFARELLRRATRTLASGGDVPVRPVSVPLPVSRASAADFVRMIQLWVADRAGVPVTAPPRPCPACRSNDSEFQFLSFDQYPYRECRSCGTWFVPLVIDDRIFEEYFTRVPEARRISAAMMSGRELLTRDSDRERFGHYFQLLQPFLGHPSQPTRYLDIGCGVGHSVELAAGLGWRARGEELSEVAVATAQAKGRNVVRPGTRLPDETYDVISLFETLEHITDPDQVLADAIRALAPNGIVMITVPNRASFEISILRERCFHVFGGYEHVGHINLFDTRGISALLERHGLSLMFTDGQFSSDLSQICSHLASSGQSVPDVLASGQIEFPIAEPAHQVVNILGPAVAMLERASSRSPILIAVACRSAARPQLQPRFDAVLAQWRGQLDATIAADQAESEVEYKDTAASLQAEVNRRDAMLAGLQQTANDLQGEIGLRDKLLADLQGEVNLRDKLLDDLRAEFARTLDARARRLVRKVLGR